MKLAAPKTFSRFICVSALALIAGAQISCTASSDKSFKTLLGSSPSSDDPFGENGNSALSFSPVSTDFGVVHTMTPSTTKTITVTNDSSEAVYIAAVGNSTNSDFAVTATTCPVSPNAFASKATCTFDVVFTPVTTGVLQWTFGISFGLTAGTTSYQSLTAIKGTGATSITFPGLETIDQIRGASMRLNWTDISGENGYMIFKLNTGTGALEYVATTSADATSYTVTGLTPNTLYTFRVKAVDLFGQPDSNTVNVAATTSLAPVLTTQTALTMPTLAGALITGQTHSFDFDNVATGAGVDTNMTYTCYYDTNIDGTVFPTTSCTGLAGLTLDSNFSTNGRFAWTPSTSIGGRAFEIMVRGNDGSMNADMTFGVNVRDPYVRSNLLFEISAPFAYNGMPGKNSPVTTIFQNLYNFGGSALDAVLNGTFATRWAGDGTDRTNPYRIVFDGTSGATASRLLMSAPIPTAGDYGFSTWVKLDNTSLGRDGYLFSNGGAGTNGWSLRQDSDGNIAWDYGVYSDYETVVSSQTPEAFYKFEETSGTTATDSTTNGHDGTLQTAASITMGSTGKQGNSFTFSGNGYVQIPTPIAFDPSDPQYTISAWVETPLLTNGQWKTVTRGSTNDHHMIFNSSTNEFGSYFNSMGGFSGSGVIANNLEAGWHLFTVVGNGTSGTSYYVDGALVNTTTNYSVTNIYAIGNYQGGGQGTGNVDGVAIWLRALTDNEVMAQYASACKVAVQQGYWTHIAGVVSGTNIELFKNGSTVCSSIAMGANSTSGLNPSFGANADGTDAWPGQMADFKVYSSLSSSDVSTNFTSTKDRYMTGPASLSGLKVWVDASDPLNTGTAPSNGASVSTWKDKSGNNNNLTTVGTAPTYATNGYATGYPAIYYGGAHSHWSSYGISGAYTIVLVSRLEGTQNARVMGDHTGQNILFGYWSNLMHGFYINGAPENLFGSTTPQAIAATTQRNSYIFTRTGTSGAFKFYSKGTLYAQNSSSNSAGFSLQLGCGSGSLGECSKVYVSEFMVFNRVLSTSELSFLNTYLQAKWGY